MPPSNPPRGTASGQVGRAAGLIGATVLLSRLLGFLRDAIIAAKFGQGPVTSAYLYAFTLPDTLWSLVAGGAFFAAFVPVITEYFTREDEENAWKTYSIISTLLMVVLTIVILLSEIFARWLLQHVLAPGFPDSIPGQPGVHPLTMAVHMTRIVLPAQYCFFLGTLMMGMQQARKDFLYPALGPIIYNLGIICGGLFLSRWLGIAAFSWGALAGAFVGNLALQIWALKRHRPRFTPSLELSHPGVKRAGKLVLPVIFGVSLPQATSLVNGIVVASVGSAKAILENTNRLMQLPLGIFGQAIGIAVLPTLSQQAAQSDMKAFRRTLSGGIRLALFLTVPTSVLLVVLARPLITVVYQHGKFTGADTESAIPALMLYAIGVWAWSAQAVVARAFYAKNDTWTPVLAGTFVTFFIFVPLNFILARVFADPSNPNLLTRGPALATSIASMVNTGLLMVFAARRFGGIGLRRIVISLGKIGLATIPMGVLAVYTHHFLEAHGGHGHLIALAQLALAGGVGLLLFLACTILLKCDEMRDLLDMYLRRH